MKHLISGNKIAALRNQKSMTQKELADRCSVDIRTIQRIESGEVIPRVYTLKLLAAALECEITQLTDDGQSAERHAMQPELKLSLVAGIIFSVNAILVIYNIITESFNVYAYMITMAIQAVSCIFYFKGFYQLGQIKKNKIMEISALLAMILLPVLNIGDMLKDLYFFGLMPTIFTALCINGVLTGIGFLLEGNKQKHAVSTNLYRVVAFAQIVSSIMYLTLDHAIISAGLILSIPSNFLTLIILYREHRYAGTADAGDPEHRLAHQ